MNNPSGKRKFLKTLNYLKIPVVVLILWWVARRVDMGDLLEKCENAETDYLVGAILLTILNLGCQCAKWHILSGMIVPERTLKKTTVSFLGGITLGLITPGRIGEAGRSVFYARKKWLELTGLFFVDKFMNFTILISYLFATVLLFRDRLVAVLTLSPDDNPTAKILTASKESSADLVVVGILFVLAIAGWVFPKTSAGFLEKVFSFGRKGLRKKFSRFLAGLRMLEPSVSLPVIMLSYGFYMAAFFQFYLLVAGFERALGFTETMFAFSIMVLSSSIPIIPGGFGTREAGSIIALGIFGISAEGALAAVLVLYLLNVFLPAVFGGLILLRTNTSGKDLRELQLQSEEFDSDAEVPS